jgi:hypothetical protein
VRGEAVLCMLRSCGPVHPCPRHFSGCGCGAESRQNIGTHAPSPVILHTHSRWALSLSAPPFAEIRKCQRSRSSPPSLWPCHSSQPQLRLELHGTTPPTLVTAASTRVTSTGAAPMPLGSNHTSCLQPRSLRTPRSTSARTFVWLGHTAQGSTTAVPQTAMVVSRAVNASSFGTTSRSTPSSQLALAPRRRAASRR